MNMPVDLWSIKEYDSYSRFLFMVVEMIAKYFRTYTFYSKYIKKKLCQEYSSPDATHVYGTGHPGDDSQIGKDDSHFRCREKLRIGVHTDLYQRRFENVSVLARAETEPQSVELLAYGD